MFAIETEVFFRSPASDEQRILIPGVVVAGEADCCVVRFDRADLPFEKDAGVLVYYHKGNAFFQQAGHVFELGERVLEGEDAPAMYVTVEMMGDAVSADSRQCYRVSTLLDELTCSVDGMAGVTLADVSFTGVSVITEATYQAGQTVSITLSHGDQAYTGPMVVNNRKELPGGMNRYGLYCADAADSKQLRHALHLMTMSLQREQLRRQSGAPVGG